MAEAGHASPICRALEMIYSGCRASMHTRAISLASECCPGFLHSARYEDGYKPTPEEFDGMGEAFTIDESDDEDAGVIAFGQKAAVNMMIPL